MFFLFLSVLRLPNNKAFACNSHHLKSIDSPRYAILKFDFLQGDFFFDRDAKPAALSSTEIENILALVYKKVVQYNDSLKRNPNLIKRYKNYYKQIFIKHPKKYYKQIVAVINPKGEKEVWINCLCEIDDTDNWRNKIIEVNGSGGCYFNLKINLTTNRVYDFSVNGVA